ncbi:helix-turn-helix domain-containing protein [Limosilactobacillus ingluviei]|uniref:helix-turn-helix domain-containing protein n=1 Tax=Limosilactobacillus ingluviei TaxID=148604 RepID=UPI0002FDF3F3|nr:helix-turn-helix transcriptional regulator [Limosilactobacillus ingluviei]MBM6729412.1 helix-turn-helix transcriptional regulator [Limosilactobacillus ingluviei]HJG49459.1 helix-turn-helix transcriptional regulator [Limosilactobacillus ingluviei]
MRLKGDVLKQIRRKRGLSQTALSEGICTQATISLMEKQNRIPKMNILTAICARLDIPVDKIIENDDVSMTSQFDEISLLIVQEDYEEAEARLKKIKVKKLQNDFDKQRYYYLLGVLQVATGQVDEAIFNFELILTQFSTMSANIYWALTTVGMAMAYEKRGNEERALKFLQRAVTLIDEKQLTGGKRQWIIIYRNIADLYLKLKQPNDAMAIAGRGIDICREDLTMFLLSDYYQITAKAAELLADRATALQNFTIAKSLLLINGEEAQAQAVQAEIDGLQ